MSKRELGLVLVAILVGYLVLPAITAKLRRGTRTTAPRKS